MINKLPERLKNEILEYCKLNSIDNIESFIIKLIRQSFTIEKFGENPIFVDKKNRIVEPEVIVKEVVVEKGLLSAERVDELLDIMAMTKGGIMGFGGGGG
jgi:hypothetical protein